MQRKPLLLLGVLLTSISSITASPFHPTRDSGSNSNTRYRMAFCPWAVFADKVRYTDFNGTKRRGIAPGANFSYVVPWQIGMGEPGTFDGGGYINFAVGNGKVKYGEGASAGSSNSIPYNFSTGAYGSYVFNNPNHEIGVDYSWIGIFGYSVYAYFGSQITLKYRYRFLQLEAMHGGDGIFRGAFSPRFNSAPTKSLGLSVLLHKKHLITGLRYTKVPSGGGTGFQVDEWRLFLGFNITEAMQD